MTGPWSGRRAGGCSGGWSWGAFERDAAAAAAAAADCDGGGAVGRSERSGGGGGR